MTGINRKNGSLRVSLSFATKRQFRSKMPFSQQLRSEFRSCEIDVTVLRSGTRVPKPLSQLRNILRNGTFGAKSRFSTSQCVLQLRNGCHCTAEWHSCAKPHFRSCEIPSQRLLQCCGMVWQQNAHFAEVSFTLRNFAELCFSPVSALFRLQFRPDFFSFNLLEISSTWDHIKRLKHT